MKNVILTHNELQLNLFLAVSWGLMQQQPAPDLHIAANLRDVKDGHFEWEVYRHHQQAGCVEDGELVFNKIINKGVSEMNDVRIGVTIGYLRDQANEFIDDLNKFLASTKRNRKQRPLQAPSAHSLEECLAELKFGRPAAAQQRLDRFIRDMNSPSSIVLDHGENKEVNDYSRFWFGLVDESDPSWSFAGYGPTPSEAALNFVNALKK